MNVVQLLEITGFSNTKKLTIIKYKMYIIYTLLLQKISEIGTRKGK